MQHSIADVGQCIYCFREDAFLSDEHIIPQGLGGRHFLTRASCPDCAKRTSRAEQEILRGCAWPARAEMGMRGKGKKRRAQIEVGVAAPLGERRTVLVRPDQLAIKAFIPTWPGPQFMIGRDPNGIVEGGVWLSFDPNASEEEDLQTHHKLNLYLISKAIGKIGHCTAVAKYGLSGATYFIPDLVMAEEPSFARFVGCAAPRTSKERAHHWSDTYEFDHPNEGTLIMGRVRLFAYLGGPIFHVVVGRLDRPASDLRFAICVGHERPEDFSQTVDEMEKASAEYSLKVTPDA